MHFIFVTDWFHNRLADGNLQNRRYFGVNGDVRNGFPADLVLLAVSLAEVKEPADVVVLVKRGKRFFDLRRRQLKRRK